MEIRKRVRIIETEEDILTKERKLEISASVDRLMRMRRKRNIRRIKSLWTKTK